MKIDIEKLTSLVKVYDYIEENAYELDSDHDFTEVWIKFREKSDSDKIKQLAQWEVEFFLFPIIGKEVFSVSTSNGKEPGEIQQFPMLDEAQFAAFSYLKARSKDALHPLLKSRYNHLLWKGVKGIKNKDFGKIAIDNYLLVVNGCINKYKETNNLKFLYNLSKFLESVIQLCCDIKHSIPEVKDVTKKILFGESNIPFYIKESIVRNMLEHSKVFEAEDFLNISSIFDSELKATDGKDDFLWVTNYFPTAIKVAQKVRENPQKWYNEIGLAYLKISEPETDENRFWIKLDNYSKAIDAFALARNNAKKLEAEQLYADLKPKVKLDSVTVSFDEDTENQFKTDQAAIKEIALKTLKRHPFLIYKSLASDPVIPELKNILNESQNKEDSFLRGINTIYFDNNKNVSSSTKDGLYNNELFTTYAYTVKFSMLPFLHYIFIFGIKSNHLNYKNFLYYLYKYTWIGKPYKKSNLSGEEFELNLINILTPSIVEYFGQIQAWTGSKYYTPSFILCLDSLTLKMEGLLRNFCERLNIPTSTSKKKGMQEIHLSDLLKHELIKKYFDENDLLLFNYVLGNEGGINLRNNVAHCFYNHTDYNPDMMLLLIEALLRISKYDPTTI